jgi:hypothetical protein
VDHNTRILGDRNSELNKEEWRVLLKEAYAGLSGQ